MPDELLLILSDLLVHKDCFLGDYLVTRGVYGPCYLNLVLLAHGRDRVSHVGRGPRRRLRLDHRLEALLRRYCLLMSLRLNLASARAGALTMCLGLAALN